MRTEQDLRHLLSDIADEVEQQDRLAQHTPTRQVEHGRGRRGTARATRRVRYALAAAVLVIVVAIGYGTATSGHKQPGLLGMPPDQTWVTSVIVPARWTLNNRLLVRGGLETVSVAAPDGQACVVTSGPAKRSPSSLHHSRDAQVNHQPAQIGKGGEPVADLGSSPDAWRVRWTPYKDRWADATCDGDTKAASTGLELAAAVKFGSTGVSVPVSLDELPEGLAANRVSFQHGIDGPAQPPKVMMQLMTGLGPSFEPSLSPSEAKKTGTKTVQAVVEKLSDYAQSPPRTQSKLFTASSRQLADLDGRQVMLMKTTDVASGASQLDLTVMDGGWVLGLSSSDYSADELVAIARSMDPAHPLGQQSKWLPATQALDD